MIFNREVKGQRVLSIMSEEVCKQGSINVEAGSIQNKTRSCKGLDKSVIRLIGATICIVVAIATWVTMAEKLQGLNDNYKHPYFITYWVHCCYTILYILWKIWVLFPGGFSCNRVGEGKLVFDLKLAVSSGFVAFAGFVSAYLWYISLTKTNIPANTAIYQSAAAIVFIISVPLLRERVTLLKILCVLLSITGVTLVAMYSTKNNCVPTVPVTNSSNETYNAYYNIDEEDDYDGPILTSSNSHGCGEPSTPLGYVYLGISVIGYAIFETFYKKFGTKKDDPASVQNGIRFVGFIGIHTLLWMWPPIIVLHYAKVEVFSWPTVEQFELMVLNAALDVVFNGALLVCIALSSPLFATVGTILAIPTSVLVDWIVQGELLAVPAFIGIVLIVLGFGGFTFSEFIATRRERRERLKKERMEMNTSCRDRSPVASETDPLIQSGGSVVTSGGSVEIVPRPPPSWRRRIIQHIHLI